MRIVGGKLKGRQIITPPGRATRPTSDRAREAMFNILAHADWAPPLDSARVIDVFAGSGALGLEAISRGAGFCVFIDMANAARRAIKENIDAMALSGVTRIHRRSAENLGDLPDSLSEPFTLAFLDPPYGKGLVTLALDRLVSGEWLSDDAIVIVEIGKDEEVELPGWNIEDERVYGAARLIFIRPSFDASQPAL
ncbi:MAG: 16S rRNA (guanine(966)-N(2))-methyltransferase RsmD [Pseudomonadota bacterium]